MPAAIVAAGIGAAGSVAGGVASGKGAKKAAKAQAQAAKEQQALQQKIYNQNEARFGTEIDNGDLANARLMSLLGLGAGDGSTPTQILRATPGYDFKMGEALRGVRSNAYARGLGNSGATARALHETAMGVADQGFNNYVNQVSGIADRGSGAKGALADVSQNFANNYNQITQNAADTASNYAMFKAQNFNNTLGGVLKAGGTLFGSSYGGAGGAGGIPAAGIPMPANSWSGR